MKVAWTVCLLIVSTGILGLLNACNRPPVVEANVIRYTIDRTPYRIINSSPEEIKVLEPHQAYVWTEVGWNQVLWCLSCIVSIENDRGEFIPSGSEWVDARTNKSPLCIEGSQCKNFYALRYRVPKLVGRIFVVYTYEGQPGDPSHAESGQLKISLSPSDPFHYTIHNYSVETFNLCWGQEPYEAYWGRQSRLERRTEYSTWEIIPTHLNLCESGELGITIDGGQSAIIDATQAYPDYMRLAPGVYRWVIFLYRGFSLMDGYLFFSPRFEWGAQK